MIRYINKSLIDKNKNDLKNLFKSEGLIFLDDYSLKIYNEYLNNFVTLN